MLHVLKICSLLLLSSIQLYEYACLFIRSPVDGHLGCFQFGAVMNKVAINIFVKFFLWTQEWLRLGVSTWHIIGILDRIFFKIFHGD